MWLDFLIVVAGLLLLLGGGDVVVRGAASLARRLGVSPLAVGLTVVAFGTSAPELAVNVTAAMSGNMHMSFGNIFGSNMANIGLITAAAALVKPLEIKSVVVAREVPMMLLVTAMAAVLGLDASLSGRPSSFDRGDGLALLLLFMVFIYYTVNDVLEQRRAHRNGPMMAEAAEDANVPPERGIVLSVALVLVGLGALVLGARVTVAGAVDLAVALGVSEDLIGLTLVAVGTSLPELAASVVATLRGHTDLAIGNVVGSNIFNLGLILGSTATIREIPVPPRGADDIAVVALLSIGLWVASSRFGGGRIVRAEAVVLLLLYVGYITLRSILV